MARKALKTALAEQSALNYLLLALDPHMEPPAPSDVPCWLGGERSVDDVLSSCNKKLLRTPDGPAEANEAELSALRECLTSLANGGGGNRCGCHRRTIHSTKLDVRCGETLSVVHVYEVVPPVEHPVMLHSMGPKEVLGEYVDGELAACGDAGDEALVDEAREAFAHCDKSGAGLDADQAWAALKLVSLDGTLRLDDGDESSAMDDEQRRATLRRLGGDRWSEATFLQICRNCLGRGSYDGAVELGPGVDCNWAVTRHAFDSPGEHTISWHGLEHFAGPAASNVLTVSVVE